MSSTAISASLRYWYGAHLHDFLRTHSDSILAELTKNCPFTLLPSQRDAWLAQIEILRSQINGLDGSIFFEFNIPRMGRRIDTVLLIGPCVFVLEFKVGEKLFDCSSRDQVWDYALDLKNFHKASHDAPIVPILVATESADYAPIKLQIDSDKVFRPIPVNSHGIRSAVNSTLQTVIGIQLDAQSWAAATYHPTPTIVEAARALYGNHSVEAIARFDAGAQNLQTTSRRIEELVDKARAEKQKLICFVTGVPGAGKTLVGLNLATRRREANQPTHAVFLSGNGPLVTVLREALTRDEVVRRKTAGEKVKKGKVGESVKSFIQNVHHFRDDGLIDSNPPVEHVVIFDEAQRAWNLKQTANFMARKKQRPGFSQSEPEFLISYTNRHTDWAVIVCLVGGGQEINLGEAGISAWLDAVISQFPEWYVHISSKLSDSEYAAGHALDSIVKRPRTVIDDSLHLAVSMRSFRAENVSSFVKALLDCEKNRARETLSDLIGRYPIAVTRNLETAKKWIRQHARGTERYGMVASSKAMRLKPHAIDIRVSVDPIHYFLNDAQDTRSSYYLEDAATEFQVQGLELDWVSVNWDGDFRFNGVDWSYHDFRGKNWCNISNADNRNYLRNAYRVLLTRARQGMILFIPPGDSNDLTRPPQFYDCTFDYLRELGIPEAP